MSDPNFHITTPRLYISYFQPTNPTHCDFLVALYNSPAFLAMSGGKTSITTRQAAEERLSGRFLEEHARNGYGTYLVSLRPESTWNEPEDETMPFPDRLSACKHIGTVSLMRGVLPDAYSVPDLGFGILPEEMRKGYAREASVGLLEWAEKEIGVHEVIGLFDPSNEGSKGVFRSLGFDDRGVHVLKVFGGVKGAVWTKPGMNSDLSVYGI